MLIELNIPMQKKVGQGLDLISVRCAMRKNSARVIILESWSIQMVCVGETEILPIYVPLHFSQFHLRIVF